MDKKNLMPQQAQPIERITTGQLPELLAELSEEALQLHGADSGIDPSRGFADGCLGGCMCSYDGDDAE